MTKFRPARSAERQALADAIEVRDAAKKAVVACEAAVATTREKIWAARRGVEAADAAAAEAKTTLAQHVLASALGEAGAPPMTPAEARALATAARDELATLKETLEALEKLTTERGYTLSFKENAVRERCAEVVKSDPGLKAMLTKFEALYREFAAQRRALEYLAARGMLPAEPRYVRNEPRDPPGDAPWKAAIAALAENCDAELPTT